MSAPVSTRSVIVVRALWDSEAQVWVAESEDVPGLITEAPTIEALSAKLVVMIPELLEANGVAFALPEIPVHIMAERTTRIANPRTSP
jgi:Domain of unknown function (DUF1902)